MTKKYNSWTLPRELWKDPFEEIFAGMTQEELAEAVRRAAKYPQTPKEREEFEARVAEAQKPFESRPIPPEVLYMPLDYRMSKH